MRHFYFLFGFGELYFFDIDFLKPPLHNVDLLLCYMAGLGPDNRLPPLLLYSLHVVFS